MSNRPKPTNPQAARSPSEMFDKQLLLACTELLPRLGATAFESRHSEPEETGSPIAWLAIAHFSHLRFEVAAAFDPATASYRLLEQLVDGGTCQHCHKPTGVTRDFTRQLAEQLVCWYQLDPELNKFRRGCA